MKQKQNGIAIVEFTLVLPVLLFILIAVLDFGRAMHAGIVLNSATRAAVGYGAQDIDKSVDINGMTSIANLEAQQMLDADDEEDVINLQITNSLQCSCSDGVSTQINTDEDCDTNNACLVARYVVVDATYDFKTLISFPFIPDTVSLSRSASMRLE
ncbi:pilus assembly protein [Photobacterium sp. BZF1]|uniref:TadE/TadG family type IV pilus assembly protein n=1 Tax=Photobacterium sp. BZF1 TaxID=1904457 RepID=UPI001653EE25|nr:TadE family protein [Photobacterium sp. BZF1]MBC7005068.1 pilus assembly protein [Photobacterium sp. BZF1]